MATAVVDPVKMPKMKADNKLIAGINAASITLATFMGWMAIFAGIAAFTKKGWGVSIPFADFLLGVNMGYTTVAFGAGILCVVLAIIGLITAGKITDINAMKSSWKCARNFFVVVAAIEIIKMVTLAIYSLCGIGEKSGVQQGYLWLNGFLSNTLAALGAVGIAFVSHAIATGKTTALSVMRFVALGVAAVACVLVFVSTIVNFYNKKTTPSSSLEDSDWSSLYNLFK